MSTATPTTDHRKHWHGSTCDRTLSMSPGKLSTKRQALTYRQHFAARWSRFINENFEGPEHVAHLFGVDGSTARKWWEGSHAPSGFAVAYAYERFPAEAADALRSAA